MFKLVVLCSVLAAAVAEPGAAIAGFAPAYSYSSSYLTPATYASPYLATGYAAPALSTSYLSHGLAYSAPAHFIKKRSVAPLATSYIAPSLIAPSSYSYSYSSPLLTSTYAAAPVYSSAHLTAPIAYSGHFIKKRSAPLAAVSTYSAIPALPAAPLYNTYAASPIAYSSPLGYSPYSYFYKK